MEIHLTMRERFMRGIDENWQWIAGKNWNGYGMLRDDRGKMTTAHRVAYRLFIGEIPEGLCVCHSCDIPSCCNPEHLWLGTRRDNVQDMLAKGRRKSRKGKRNNIRKNT